MEFLNKVQIRGIVGTVRETAVLDTHCYRFSVVTERVYRSLASDATVECTWHNVAAYAPKGVAWDWLKKGACVEIHGCLRTQRYISASGEERHVAEILADSVTQVEG